MKKIITSTIIICLLVFSISGCVISPIEKDVVSFPNNNRLDDIQSKEDFNDSVVINSTIDEWISDYNTQSPVEIIDNYYITQNGEHFYVHTDKNVYTVTLDNNNEVILFTLNTGSLKDKLHVANVSMDIFTNRQYIPVNVQNQMNLIEDEYIVLKERVDEYVSSFNTEALDTSINSLSDLETAAKQLLDKIEQYKIDIS